MYLPLSTDELQQFLNRVLILSYCSNVSEEVAVTILCALIPIGSHILSPVVEGTGFAELMVVMATLADAGSGKGHKHLFLAATEWLELW